MQSPEAKVLGPQVLRPQVLMTNVLRPDILHEANYSGVRAHHMMYCGLLLYQESPTPTQPPSR